MLTNELWTASFQNPWGPTQYESYELLEEFPTYSFHKHENTSEGASFLKREIVPGSNSQFDIELYDWNQAEWNRTSTASYSGGFA